MYFPPTPNSFEKLYCTDKTPGGSRHKSDTATKTGRNFTAGALIRSRIRAGYGADARPLQMRLLCGGRARVTPPNICSGEHSFITFSPLDCGRRGF
ncbi:hypothetical protein EVAR_52913_1 [Eumeta japonica]|uniref:Uncharacterized protein n=1 Tax=Eumeta variegata TaxID=151549 RepID=A0A4C1Y8B9_EUMVA|nr:hypothetical protein EVAR_52913_1 [Eumeta japonica]